MVKRALVLMALVLAQACLAQSVATIQPFDTLTVVTAGQPQYSGDFVVASDGTVTVQVLGRFSVGGHTLAEAESAIQAKAREFVRDAMVTVILKTQADRFVYFVTDRITDGAVKWTPGLSVRQVISRSTELQPLDSYTARLYRKGFPTVEIDVVKLLRSNDEAQNRSLEPGDVLALLPAATKMVWVVGAVSRPGQVRLEPDRGVSAAIALAGGVAASAFSPTQVTVLLRRGDQTQQASLAEVDTKKNWGLEAGDTIIVQLPKTIRVTVGGYVAKPGELTVRDDTTLLASVQDAGGALETGTLQRTLLVRKGEVRVIDLRNVSQGGTELGVTLQDGDFVYVPENKRDYQVFGFVNKPGRKLIPDGREIKLSDALAAAEGLKEKGTYRKVVILRADKEGRFVPTRYDLDRYMKDGVKSENPTLRAGDIVFFDQISGTTIQDVLRFLPSLLLVDRMF